MVALSLKNYITVDRQWLEHLWKQENMFEAGLFELMSVTHNDRTGGII